MIGLIEGRNVHYVGDDGFHNAAQIVEVTDAPNRIVSVFVFPKRQGEVGGVVQNVAFYPSSTEKRTTKPGTWHWHEIVGRPEKAVEA